MRPEDISRLVIPSDPRLSPDGSRLAWGTSVADVEEDRYDKRVWVYSSSGPHPFTTGPGDTSPRWSPDGTRLAFLRKVDPNKPQVAVMPADGGEPLVVSAFEYGVEALEWAPDGSHIAVVAVTPTSEWEGLDEEERKRRPRRILSFPYRYDNKGWLDDRRRHVWLVDPDGVEAPACLTPGYYDEESLAWSPDGSRIAYITDRDPDRGLSVGVDVFEVDVETGQSRRVASRGHWSALGYRPDGALHLLGNDDLTYPTIFFLYRREDDGALTNLTEPLDRGSVSLAAGPGAIRWDGKDAVIGLEDSGRFGLVRVAPDGTTEPVVGGDRVVTGYDSAGDRLVFTASSWDSPGEVYEASDGTERQISAHNDEDLELVQPEHFRVTSEGVEVDVWVYLPETDSKLPLVLNIHGGPASQYGFGFFDEFQVYASAGYGVVAANPRGSSGRGLEFLRAVVGEGWGKVDLEDIRAVMTAVEQRYPTLDQGRKGIMGGSYGGFLTAWVIGHDGSWKSAVVERALTSWTSFSGTSDIGGVFPHAYTGVSYPDAWNTWWEMSPLALAHRVTTPTLVIHSEDDFRCPIEQAEQYFMALLRNGTPTELLRFPGEGHEMSRSGKPRHRIERFEAILEWHGKHLA